MTKVYANTLPDMAELLTNAGIELVSSFNESDYTYVELDSETATFVANAVEAKANISLDPNIYDKRWLMKTISKLGYNAIPTVDLLSLSDLERFTYTPLISKPANGVGRKSPSPFDYVTYQTNQEAIIAFNNDTTNTLLQRKPILQPSYAKDGNTDILMISSAINGKGQVHIEPLILAKHVESGGAVNFSTRGCSELLPGVEEAKQTLIGLANHLQLRNTFFLIQFIWDGSKYLAMDACYRLDYHNRYILPKFDNSHVLNLIRYTFDMVESVGAGCQEITAMQYINIPLTTTNEVIKQALTDNNISMLTPHKQDRWRLFGTTGMTEQDVTTRLSTFTRIIST